MVITVASGKRVCARMLSMDVQRTDPRLIAEDWAERIRAHQLRRPDLKLDDHRGVEAAEFVALSGGRTAIQFPGSTLIV